MSGFRRQRDLLDRVLVRFPALAGISGAIFRRTRPGSPARKRLLNSVVERGFAAMARNDLEVVLAFYEPNAEIRMRGMEGVGMSGFYNGHQGIRALFAEVGDAWSDWQWSVGEIVDFEDGFAVRVDFVGYGRASGAETIFNGGGTRFAFSRRGRVARQAWFIEQGGWEKALEAGAL